MNIIEDGGNTSYIDSILLYLFYNNQELLNNDPENNKYIYLQEIIKTKFIEPVKKNNVIFSNIMSEIQNYLFFFGFNNKNPIELFIFLFEKLNFEPIRISFINNTFETIKQNISHINLIADKDCTIKELYINFVQNNNEILDFKNNIEILNLPKQINFHIERKCSCKVDILNIISLFVNDSIKEKEFKWKFNSLIGFSNGKYYSIIHENKKLYIVKNSMIPSKILIDRSIIDMIKNEVIFVSYLSK